MGILGGESVAALPQPMTEWDEWDIWDSWDCENYAAVPSVPFVPLFFILQLQTHAYAIYYYMNYLV